MLFFIHLFFFSAIQLSLYADDDIWFLLPSNNQPVSGKVEIKIYPPPYPVDVYIWIEHKSTDRKVWHGMLKSSEEYTTTVDTGRFKPGKYEINAQYFLGDEDYEGDITIWVNPL